MDVILLQALGEADLREVRGGTPDRGGAPPLRPGAARPAALASLPVLPLLPPWIEEAIGSWAGGLALDYGRAFLAHNWEHRVESTARALPPMAMRPLAERTHRWLN